MHAYAWLWLADLPLLALSLCALWRWWPSGPRPGILTVLFLGLAWLPATFALYTVQSLVYFAGDGFILGRAPAHALFVGFFGSVLVAMVTRVTQGHSGQAIRMPGVAWFAFVAIQLVAAARILASARPDAQLRTLCASPDYLEAVLMGALTFVRPDIGVEPALAANVAHTHRVLHKSLTPSRRLRLAHAVEALIASGTRHDTLAWWHAVDCTAQRVALLLSGDLQVAIDLISRDNPAPEASIADVLRFSMSQALGDMRRDLDIAACSS